MGHDRPPAVKPHFGAAYAQHGYTTAGRHGDQVADEDALRRRLFDTLCAPDRIVHHPDRRDDLARTPAELVCELFPRLGTDDDRDEDAPDPDTVRRDLERHMWDLVQSGARGHVQMRIGQAGLPLLLCRAKVARPDGPQDACYVTDNADLIMADLLQPHIDRLAAHAERTRSDLEFLVELQPQMAAAIDAQIEDAIDDLYERSGINRPDKP